MKPPELTQFPWKRLTSDAAGWNVGAWSVLALFHNSDLPNPLSRFQRCCGIATDLRFSIKGMSDGWPRGVTRARRAPSQLSFGGFPCELTPPPNVVLNHFLLRSLGTDTIDVQVVFQPLRCLPHTAGAGLASLSPDAHLTCALCCCCWQIQAASIVIQHFLLLQNHVLSCREKFTLNSRGMRNTSLWHFIVKAPTEEKRLEAEYLSPAFSIWSPFPFLRPSMSLNVEQSRRGSHFTQLPLCADAGPVSCSAPLRLTMSAARCNPPAPHSHVWILQQVTEGKRRLLWRVASTRLWRDDTGEMCPSMCWPLSSDEIPPQTVAFMCKHSHRAKYVVDQTGSNAPP